MPRQQALEEGAVDFISGSVPQKLALWKQEMYQTGLPCYGVFTYYTFAVLTPYK
jgi:hypothetical protein